MNFIVVVRWTELIDCVKMTVPLHISYRSWCPSATHVMNLMSRWASSSGISSIPPILPTWPTHRDNSVLVLFYN